MGRRNRKSKRRMNSLLMMLLLTAVFMVVSTYAWFSANREVAITGITAKVSAAEGLQISLDAENWGSSVEVNSAALARVGTAKNNYVWPEELVPVSTDGTISGNDVKFTYGDVSADGSILNSCVDAPASGGKYISFDVYFKNSSSNTAGDKLQLNSTSYVQIHTKADGEGDDLDGKAETGLENCVRAGVLLYDSTSTFTTAAATIRAMTPDTAPLFSVWEPNYTQHIGEVVTNDGRIDAADDAFDTWAMKVNSQGFNIKGVNGDTGTASKVDAEGADIASSEGVYMQQLKTLTSASGTAAITDMKSSTGVDSSGSVTFPQTQLMLGQNKIMKARVYIWLEGQDPDCNDTASTGRAFDIVLGFTKPAKTTSGGSGGGSSTGG